MRTFPIAALAMLGCVGRTEAPIVPPELPESLASCLVASTPTACTSGTLTATVVDWALGNAVQGLAVGTCAISDTTCALVQPVAPNPGTVAAITIPLPASCDYRAILTAPNEVPFDWYFSPPLHVQTVDPTLVFMMSPPVLAGRFGGLGAKFDATKPIAILRVFDCSDAPAAGVRFTASGQPDAFAFVLGSSSDMPDGTTDATGQYGFANLAPGPVTVQAYRGETPLGDPVTFAVREGWGTLVDVRPRVSGI